MSGVSGFQPHDPDPWDTPAPYLRIPDMSSHTVTVDGEEVTVDVEDDVRVRGYCRA
ncbi:hypothetical protein GCM10025792_03190 [Pseudonocardia tropica]